MKGTPFLVVALLLVAPAAEANRDRAAEPPPPITFYAKPENTVAGCWPRELRYERLVDGELETVAVPVMQAGCYPVPIDGTVQPETVRLCCAPELDPRYDTRYPPGTPASEIPTGCSPQPPAVDLTGEYAGVCTAP